jgi:hypothetical protein
MANFELSARQSHLSALVTNANLVQLCGIIGSFLKKLNAGTDSG